MICHVSCTTAAETRDFAGERLPPSAAQPGGHSRAAGRLLAETESFIGRQDPGALTAPPVVFLQYAMCNGEFYRS